MKLRVLGTTGEIIVVILYALLFFRSLSHDPYVRLYLARLYVNQKGDCFTAIELLEKETTVSPDVEFHTTLAQCYLKLGNTEKAAPHLKKVLRLQPDNKSVLQILKTIHDGKKE